MCTNVNLLDITSAHAHAKRYMWCYSRYHHVIGQSRFCTGYQSSAYLLLATITILTRRTMVWRVLSGIAILLGIYTAVRIHGYITQTKHKGEMSKAKHLKSLGHHSHRSHLHNCTVLYMWISRLLHMQAKNLSWFCDGSNAGLFNRHECLIGLTTYAAYLNFLLTSKCVCMYRFKLNQQRN